MPSIYYYIYRMIFSILTLFLLTKVYMQHPGSTLWKAVWVSLVLTLFQYLGFKLIGNPTGFHSSIFANIGKVLLMIPAAIAFILFYRMTIQDYAKFFVSSIVLSVITFPINKMALSLLG